MTNKVYQLPYGTKDILPGQMKTRRSVEDAIIRVFDKWGYDEVKTPDFEYVDTFGASGAKGDFRFFDRSNNLLVLRNDMTAPIARLTATRLQGGEKIKRLCYLANLYRYEEIQAGRQCEFEQAGVEMLGASGAAADAEVIVLAAAAMKAAGVERFAISLGHVDFINGLAEEAGFDAAQLRELKACLRRHDAVAMQELADSMENIRPEIKQLFADFLFLQGGPELLERIGQVVKQEKCLSALDNLRRIYALVEAYGAAEYLSFDLGLYRSLDYYTGMLFEIYLPELGYPVAGGGRYDKMMQSFGMDCPATGFALGVDRILLALERTGAVNNERGWDAFVGWSEGKLPEAIAKATALRSEGRSVKLATEAMELADAAKAMREYGCSSLVYVE
ncbi:ATP phosphoribosyltransferase regulatory subunit [uncultured Phascolarctobacterium sp.]|uniref:ATP phosphoribosyltransferase regulatory subunit n=1 Tax=uncultured Phascolarctobacterium sp. TaxID=512296 RepID=UPI0025D3104B|nr:ATP phosphoribosyltransferase regulatory subunit [uncultured Phascolarctobacterium sp.]